MIAPMSRCFSDSAIQEAPFRILGKPCSREVYCGAGAGLAGAADGVSVAGGVTGGRFDGGGAAAGSPLSRTLFGGIGVMSGFGAGGVGGASWIRSLGAPFTFFGFFLVAVSPRSPRGAFCTCCAAFSSAVRGGGVAAAFCLVLSVFAAVLVLASSGARSAKRVLPWEALGASGSTSEVVVDWSIDAIAAPGGGRVLAAPGPWSEPEASVSSGATGSELRGACP